MGPHVPAQAPAPLRHPRAATGLTGKMGVAFAALTARRAEKGNYRRVSAT